MEQQRTVHQIFFFNFDDRTLQDYPVFVKSAEAWSSFSGWGYKLWNEADAEKLCQSTYPQLWETYRALRFPIQQVDLLKYMIADNFSRSGQETLVCDLDVLPLCHPDEIVADKDYMFDRCTRKGIVCNDILFVKSAGLPCIFDYFIENLARVNGIKAYEQRKMRYVFQCGGPDFLTRYIKRAGLSKYVRSISNRTFLEAKQQHRNVFAEDAKVLVIHQLSWRPQLRQPERRALLEEDEGGL